MKKGQKSGALNLQERDWALLLGLFDCRVMTLSHIAKLYFDRKAEATKKRIQKLKAAGYVAERARLRHERAVLTLTKKGFNALATNGRLPAVSGMTWGKVKQRLQVSELTIRHELAVLDVRVAPSAIDATDRMEIAEFCCWPSRIQFQATANPHTPDSIVKPDAFLRVREEVDDGVVEHYLYIEVDRSTETQDQLVTRAACYADHYRRGGLAVMLGGWATDYQLFPFRTLIIVRNAERRNNTAERLLSLNPPIRSQVWLTTMNEIISDPLGPIWVRPLDYAAAVVGTQFDVPNLGLIPGYRRQSEREELVEARITKHRLLSD